MSQIYFSWILKIPEVKNVKNYVKAVKCMFNLRDIEENLNFFHIFSIYLYHIIITYSSR